MAPENPSRKPYDRPSLTVYGSVKTLTAGGDASPLSDSGSNMMMPGS